MRWSWRAAAVAAFALGAGGAFFLFHDPDRSSSAVGDTTPSQRGTGAHDDIDAALGGSGQVEVVLRNHHPRERDYVVSICAYNRRECDLGAPTADGKCRFSDLPPDKYLVEVYTRDPHQYVGKGTVNVVPGKVTSVTIDLDDLLDPAFRVTVDGTLEIPPAWGGVDATLVLAAHVAPAWAPARPKVALQGGRWSCPEVVPGKYVLEVRPFTYQVPLIVGRQGLRGLKISVPPPIDVTVRTLDADSRLPTGVTRLEWHSKWADPEPLDGSTPVPLDGLTAPGGEPGVALRDRDGAFHFRAPAGRLVVAPPRAPDNAGYYRDDSEHDIGPGPADLTITLQRECGFTVIISKSITLNDEDLLSVPDISIQGAGDVCMFGRDHETRLFRIWLTRPGKYRVSSESLGIPPQDIIVKPGELTEVRGE